jgi:hypothetical protein
LPSVIGVAGVDPVERCSVAALDDAVRRLLLHDLALPIDYVLRQDRGDRRIAGGVVFAGWKAL